MKKKKAKTKKDKAGIKKNKAGVKSSIRDIIFRHDTPKGKAFDIALLVLIIMSILVVMLESVHSLNDRFHEVFLVIEWILTILFTIEYILRIYTVEKKLAYITSFYGIVDLMSIVPTYLTLFALPIQYLSTVRILRLLRVFRIFKLTQFLGESKILVSALKASRPKITVFITTVVICSVIIGSVMYMVEGEENGFTSIPKSIYWAIVTLTTVGYGDIAPQTSLGQGLAALLMIMGYGIIAVPTGIVTTELANASRDAEDDDTIECPVCDTSELDADSKFCKHCGTGLEDLLK